MTNEKAIMCLEDMKIKVPIPKAAKQARENNEALDVAIKALKNEPHWIPVEHDLPKENYLDDGYVEPSQPVLVYMSYRTCKISRYWGHRKSKGTSDYVIPDWMDLEDYEGDNVIAWMPLPESYRGE